MSQDDRTPKPSVTAKIEPSRIKRALKRRRKARRVTHLYDPSVPRSMMFLGIINRARRKQGKLPVHVGNHQLSPFVVHLNPELSDPQTVLEEELLPVSGPNLLFGEEHQVAIEAVSEREIANDLAVGFEDLTSQLTEDLLDTPSSWTKWVLPTSRITTDPIGKRTQPAFDHPEPLIGAFATDPIHPPTPPDTFENYFDLPDEDPEEQAVAEHEEADLVSWDDIAQGQDAEPEPEPTASNQPRVRAPSRNPLHALRQKLPFALPTGWTRAVGAFIVLSFVFVLPIYAMNTVSGLKQTKTVLDKTGAVAIDQLHSGANAALVRDVEGASNAFQQANKSFENAAGAIDRLGSGTSLLLSVLPGTNKYYRTGEHLLQAGRELSTAGEQLAQGFSTLQEEINPSLTSRLSLLETYAGAALGHLSEANRRMERIDDEVIPAQHRETLSMMRAQLPSVIRSLDEFLEFSEMARTVLGDEQKKRYLVVFQNNTELRATGGFIGSFAEIDVKDGEIVDMHVPGGGSYDLQGSLKTSLVAPQPLQLLRARWEFQDANWFPDFPTSARQMLTLHESAGGPTVDGVISINATYVADLLALTGPIEMPEYGRTITSENFLLEAQKIVELEYDKEENRPKAFIGDLAPKVLERVKQQSAEDFLSFVEFLNTGLTERHVQMYFTNNELQRQIHALGWDGAIKWTDGDYLMIIDSNLGGGKTDGVIGQRVDMDVDIASDGTVTNTVHIERKHYGIENALFSGVNNVDYLRLYVPKGSELIDADGFTIPDASLFETPDDGWTIDDNLLYMAKTRDVDPKTGTVSYDAFGKTVFGNWVQTKPGATSDVVFRYRLPFKVDLLDKQPGVLDKIKQTIGVPETDRYTLTIQKQSGVLDRTTNVEVHTPNDLETIWSSHNLAKTVFKNNADAFMAVLFEKRYDE